MPALRLWLAARFLDTEGSGVVPVHQLVSLYIVEDLTKSHVYHDLAHPKAPAFFTVGIGRDDIEVVRYRSLLQVCTELGVDDPGRPQAVDGRHLGNVKRLKAQLYAAWLRNAGKRQANGSFRLTMSRAKIEALTGVCPNSQKAYERIARLKVLPNVARVEATNLGRAARYMPRRRLPDDDGDITFTTGADPDATFYTLPNSFVVATGSVLPRGRARKVKKALKHRSAAGEYSGAGKMTARFERVFFDAATLPDRYQNVPGSCLRRDAKAAELNHTRFGRQLVWDFSGLRPVSRRAAGVL